MKECTNDVCGVRRVAGKEKMVVVGGVKNLVSQWSKRELLRNGRSEEIGIRMTGTGH